MNLWKKSALALAASTIIFSPVLASAAPSLNQVRAVSLADDQSEIESTNLVPILLGLAIIAGGIWLAVDGNDRPASP